MKIDADILLRELERNKIRNEFFKRGFKSSFRYASAYHAGCVSVIDKITELVKIIFTLKN